MINCIAIDDEPIALSILEEHSRRYGNINLKSFTSPVEGLKSIRESLPDMVFLDIHLTSHNGIELARQLPEETLLIFTTAYSQYALEGFNLNAVDFLHKPIFYQRFVQAMEKATAWIAARRRAKLDDNPSVRDTITLKSGHKNVIIDIASITHVEAMDNYVKIFRRSMPMVMSQIPMKELENLLPSDKFIRVHRSFIVRLDAIDRFSNRQIFIHDISSPIPIGRTYSDSFRSRYNELL